MYYCKVSSMSFYEYDLYDSLFAVFPVAMVLMFLNGVSLIIIFHLLKATNDMFFCLFYLELTLILYKSNTD